MGDKAAKNLGKSLVSKGDTIVVESFLKDRPPPFVDVPEEEAELRVGDKADFQFDLSVGSSKSREDLVVSGPSFGGVKWPDPPPAEGENPDDPNNDQVVNVDIYETNRTIETIRVEGDDGVSYVDLQRIDTITFKMPDKRGPTGTITEYWTYHLNWDSPVINGVDTSKLNLKDGETVVDVKDA